MTAPRTAVSQPRVSVSTAQRAAISASMIARAAFHAALIVACVASLLYYAVLGAFMVRRLHMNDFGKFYYATQNYVRGGDLYATTVATRMTVAAGDVRELLNMNPPHFHLLMLPLAPLSPAAALAWWAAINVLALVVSVWLIARELELRWTPARVFYAIAGVILCSATGTIVLTGQFTFLLLLPVTYAWIAARRDRWPQAAVWLGICASLKPFLGLFLLYLLIARRFKAAGIMMISGAMCGIVGVAVFGVTAYVNWLHAMAAVDWNWAFMNGSIAGIIARAFGPSPVYEAIANESRIVTPLATTVSVLCAAFAMRSFVADKSEGSTDRTFAGLLVTSLLVSPLGWIYYVWLVAGPAVAVSRTARSRRSKVRNIFASTALIGLLVPVGIIGYLHMPPSVGLTLGSINSWTLLALWSAIIADGHAAARATDIPIANAPTVPSVDDCMAVVETSV